MHSFVALPLPDQPVPRLLLRVEIEHRVPLLCLIDTGAIATRLPAWVTDALALDLRGAVTRTIWLGGVRTVARRAEVELTVGDDSFACPVWFCDAWSPPFGLLGQDDFLRRYRLTLAVAEEWFSLERDSA